ncbi:MAG TPA: DUF3754 domain-containing protein [Candidatus Poseidoniales archaeon]|jgi:hypothetical protein|nr:DUF3754 domain-containing protein [Candidatus Poseidoniales archaeon]
MAEVRHQYIPVSRSKIKEKLFENWEFSVEELTKLQNLSTMFEAIWHHNCHHDLEELKSLYESMDPDTEEQIEMYGKERFLEVLEKSLKDGNWKDISEKELTEALEGEDILPISLDIRLDELNVMKLYKLGESTISDIRTTHFGFRKQEVQIETFSQVIQVIEFHDKEWFGSNRKRMKNYPGDDEIDGLHLRLFRTVPKLDLETIFPNTTPLMRNLDKIKIAAPLIGGVVGIAMKFGPVIFGQEQGETGISLLGGVLTALGTYILKTYLAYQKTREKFQTQVSKDMYFKGQANNSAVLNMIVDLGEEQEVKEALLAYAFLHYDTDYQHNEKSLDDKIEEWLLDTFAVDIDFEVDDALAKLEKMKLLNTDENGILSVVPIENSLTILDEYWDNIYDF